VNNLTTNGPICGPEGTAGGGTTTLFFFQRTYRTTDEENLYVAPFAYETPEPSGLVFESTNV
jgi:hypothetical protein